jgi:hypothetical protein
MNLIHNYSCSGRSFISVLSDAVETGVLTDKTVRYPSLGDYNSYDMLSWDDQDTWRAALDARLAAAGWQLIMLPCPGCCQHPGDGDATMAAINWQWGALQSPSNC